MIPKLDMGAVGYGAVRRSVTDEMKRAMGGVQREETEELLSGMLVDDCVQEVDVRGMGVTIVEPYVGLGFPGDIGLEVDSISLGRPKYSRPPGVPLNKDVEGRSRNSGPELSCIGAHAIAKVRYRRAYGDGSEEPVEYVLPSYVITLAGMDILRMPGDGPMPMLPAIQLLLDMMSPKVVINLAKRLGPGWLKELVAGCPDFRERIAWSYATAITDSDATSTGLRGMASVEELLIFLGIDYDIEHRMSFADVLTSSDSYLDVSGFEWPNVVGMVYHGAIAYTRSRIADADGAVVELLHSSHRGSTVFTAIMRDGTVFSSMNLHQLLGTSPAATVFAHLLVNATPECISDMTGRLGADFLTDVVLGACEDDDPERMEWIIHELKVFDKVSATTAEALTAILSTLSGLWEARKNARFQRTIGLAPSEILDKLWRPTEDSSFLSLDVSERNSARSPRLPGFYSDDLSGLRNLAFSYSGGGYYGVPTDPIERFKSAMRVRDRCEAVACNSLLVKRIIPLSGTKARFILRNPLVVNAFRYRLWRFAENPERPGRILEIRVAALDVEGFVNPVPNGRPVTPSVTAWADEECTVHASHPNIKDGSVCLGDLVEVVARTASARMCGIRLVDILDVIKTANMDSAYHKKFSNILKAPNTSVTLEELRADPGLIATYNGGIDVREAIARLTNVRVQEVTNEDGV